MLSARPDKTRAMRVYSATEGAKYLLGRGARLTLDHVYEIAAMATGGLDDPGDDRYFEEGMRQLLAATRSIHITYAGRRIMSDLMWSALARRLKLTAAKRSAPDVFAAPLRPPFLVMGMARTGTTHLHRLLAVDPRFHGPPQWELSDPFPPPDGPDGRRDLAWSRHESNKKHKGDHSNVHFASPDAPEECTVLQASQFVTGQFWGAAPVYDYVDWVLTDGEQLREPVYRDYRDYLLHLQAQHPGQALALKSPNHTARLDAVHAVLPEAMIVNTVRHPLSWANSSHSMVYQLHVPSSRRIDVPRIVATNMKMLERGSASHIAAREPSVRVIDVFYDDLMTRPIDVVRSIYDFHGVDWPEGHDAALQQYLDANQRGKHGAHNYASSDFGLTDGQVTDRFVDYIDYFGLGDSSPSS